MRPEFTPTLAIKQGKHPIRDLIGGNVVANDIYAGVGSNMVVVSGPNMVLLNNQSLENLHIFVKLHY